jgi:hypothetical protein
MPGVDRGVSKMSDILPKSGSFDNIVELSMDMIAQGSEGERRDLHANKMESRTPQFTDILNIAATSLVLFWSKIT